MPLVDTAAQNAALDACYGGDHAIMWPAAFTVRLYDDDPRNGGLELPADGGYAAIIVDNDDILFPPADGGEKVAGPFDFGTSTDAWGGVGLWVAFEDSGVIYDAVDIPDPVVVDAADQSVLVVATLFHQDSV